MTALRVRHIADSLNAKFQGLIDVSDVANAPDDQKEAAFKTRALAAQAVSRIGRLDPMTAAASVIDGTGDNGIDAVFVTEEDAARSSAP